MYVCGVEVDIEQQNRIKQRLAKFALDESNDGNEPISTGCWGCWSEEEEKAEVKEKEAKEDALGSSAKKGVTQEDEIKRKERCVDRKRRNSA